MRLTYPAVFYEREGCYVVVVPDLPGCSSWGETPDEAALMGIDAASGWVLDELEDGKPVPKASLIENIHPDKDEDCVSSFVRMLTLDMASYAKRHGKKNVRRSPVIPAWQNAFSEEKHLSVSR
jgi:predicted RNase H-like HicB family nuclease